MGLLLARDAFLKSRFQWPVQKRGLPPDAARMRVLCSEVAHFTVEKSAAQLGLGTDAVVRVAVDDEFRMRPESLRTALDDMRDKNLLPFAIVATAGTTDFGSVDPLPEIAALASPLGLGCTSMQPTAAFCCFHIATGKSWRALHPRTL